MTCVSIVLIQVVPGRAGGGRFKRKKNYIAKKEFAYRMCARWPTIAMSKLFFRFERSFCPCMAVMSCALGWCVCDLTCFQVMWLVVRWFVVLLWYYCVLQRTTTYYSSTTPTYYSVLQSTTPVLLCTTTYYSSTTLYYKVLLQYYSTTQYYSSNYSLLKRHFQCAQQQEAACNFTNCCACHTKWMSPVICHTYQTSVPMRGASEVTLQPHQMLRLPLENECHQWCATHIKRQMQVINDLRHICNLISTARSKQRHPATSPNTAPATQNASHQWSASHMQPHFQCAEQAKAPCNLTKYCACHAKCKSSMICVTYATSFPMRGCSKVTVQPHQTLRLPRNLEAQDFSGNSLNASANRKTIRG